MTSGTYDMSTDKKNTHKETRKPSVAVVPALVLPVLPPIASVTPAHKTTTDDKAKRKVVVAAKPKPLETRKPVAKVVSGKKVGAKKVVRKPAAKKAVVSKPASKMSVGRQAAVTKEATDAMGKVAKHASIAEKLLRSVVDKAAEKIAAHVAAAKRAVADAASKRSAAQAKKVSSKKTARKAAPKEAAVKKSASSKVASKATKRSTASKTAGVTATRHPVAAKKAAGKKR